MSEQGKTWTPDWSLPFTYAVENFYGIRDDHVIRLGKQAALRMPCSDGYDNRARVTMQRLADCGTACAGISDPAAAIREAREAMQMTLDYDTMDAGDFEKKYGGRDKAHWLGTRVRLRSALAKLGGAA